jgi:RecB family exonuclease
LKPQNSSLQSCDPSLMGHSIYTGPFSALETRWIEIIAALQRKDPLFEINVLIGSNILATYLKRRLAGSGKAVANIRFYNFLDLADHLARPAEQALTKPRLPHLGASIILENILAAHTPPVFGTVCGFPGFRDALLDTFRDLRDAGISPMQLERVIDKSEFLDRRPHLLGLADLYRRFRGQISLFHDVDDDFRTAIRNLGQGNHPGAGPLLIYGIYDATGQQSQMLSALKDAFELTYFIPFTDASISEFARPFLESRIAELGVESIPLRGKPSVSSLDMVAFRGFGLGRASGEAVPPDGSLALVSAPGESRAAVEIVREIMRAVRDGVIGGLHEAAVILRQPEDEIPIIAEMLRLRGIPYFVQGGTSFAERPFSKAVVAISTLESNSFSRQAVLNAMELTAASLPEEFQPGWDVQGWRALTNSPRFLSGLESWDTGTQALVWEAQKDLRRAKARISGGLKEEDNGNRERSVESASMRLEIATSLQNAWQLLRGSATAWPDSLGWEDWAEFLERRFEPVLGGSADWASFLNILDELRNLQALSEISGSAAQESFARMQGILAQSLASLTCRAGMFQRSGVNLLPISAARGLRFPLVIIPGLEEGRFPARLRQDSLLLDAERFRMDGMPIKSKRIEEEKLLFDMASRSAEKRLVLITSRLDESSDRERIPSQFFLSTASSAQGRVVSSRDLSTGKIVGFRSISLDNPAPGENEVPVDEGEIRLRAITANRDSARTVLEVLGRMEPKRLQGPRAYDEARWRKTLTRFDGRITNPILVRKVAQKMGASAGQVSASRLEEYAKCPYYFFLKRIIKLEPWEEEINREGLDPLQRGLLVHSIVEEFLKERCGETFPSTPEEALWSILSAQAQTKLEAARPAGLPDLLWEIESESIVALLREWLAFEKRRLCEGMFVSSLERPFGVFSDEERYPAFRLQAGKHTFDFRGRIDRVDLSRDGKRARVIDYKTGMLPDSMAPRKGARQLLMSGEKIQIAVYKGALGVLEEFKEVNFVEGEYLHLQPKDARPVPCAFSVEELEKASQLLPKILEIIGDGIETGAFFARTKGAVRPYGHCDFCDYLPVCGKDRVQREERKENDPAVRRFSNLEPLP